MGDRNLSLRVKDEGGLRVAQRIFGERNRLWSGCSRQKHLAQVDDLRNKKANSAWQSDHASKCGLPCLQEKHQQYQKGWPWHLRGLEFKIWWVHPNLFSQNSPLAIPRWCWKYRRRWWWRGSWWPSWARTRHGKSLRSAPHLQMHQRTVPPLHEYVWKCLRLWDGHWRAWERKALRKWRSYDLCHGLPCLNCDPSFKCASQRLHQGVRCAHLKRNQS